MDFPRVSCLRVCRVRGSIRTSNICERKKVCVRERERERESVSQLSLGLVAGSRHVTAMCCHDKSEMPESLSRYYFALVPSGTGCWLHGSSSKPLPVCLSPSIFFLSPSLFERPVTRYSLLPRHSHCTCRGRVLSRWEAEITIPISS